MTAPATRRTVALLTGLVLLAAPAAAGALAAGPAQAATRPTWSTSPATKASTASSVPVLTGIRVGRHARFDRIVMDLSGAAPGYAVRYVTQLHHDGSGLPVDLRGQTSLKIVLRPAYAHDETGKPTLTTPSRATFAYPQIREYRLIGDFEGYVTVGVGLRHREPFRVLTLSDPARIVVDIRH